jgi:small subunit ribosomal protein S20
MPITKSAKKSLRVAQRKAPINLKIKSRFKSAVTAFRKKPTPSGLSEVYRLLDRAAKKQVIHKNKAARLKSRLSKLLKLKR